MLAGIFTNTIFGFLRCSVLLTVYEASTVVGGYDEAAMLTYVWLGQGLMNVTVVWGYIVIADRVRTGDIAIDFARPIDLQTAYLAQDFGRAGIQLLTRAVVPVLVGAIFYTIRLPEQATTWLVFAVSVVLAMMVSYAARFLLDLVTFWIVEHRGIVALYAAVAGFATGLAVPLTYLPDWLQIVVRCTPFPSILQTPIDVFVERADTGETLFLVAQQAAWVVGLMILGRYVLARGRSRLVVQGG